MDVAAVVERFELGADMRDWLADTAALPARQSGAVLPPRERASEALAPFALAGSDEAELVELWPDESWPVELWWLVEYMYARLLSDMEPPAVHWRHWPPLPHVPDARARCAPVFAFAAAVPALRAAHRRLGVPREVSAATLADVGRHVAHTRQMFGRIGLETASWIALHFRAGLFELGRLQYEPARLGPRGSVTWYGRARACSMGPEFEHGAPVLRLHIPADGPLDPAGIEESLAGARCFFRARTGVDHPVATCTSWLLDPQLARYLPQRSNIMAFQRRFTLVEQDAPGDADVFRFVFRLAQVRPEQAPQNTRLERAVVRHMRAGREWRVRTGWLRLP
ncbi:acyltransferase domain-containing protein [Allosalinactinospora lopnorensis]|uniref:acyltransferase domain-containing protein n=1 Tax=Allosalinactinospora lopnorensis TaxID=1352348 RepID=UPI0006240005|nr:acyltransferase domain-containing protein [Allosalinactinospora lopnorensis]